VAAPTLLVFGLRGPAIFDFGDEERMTDRQIAILLEGEQLVPPPPLPPAVFTTRRSSRSAPTSSMPAATGGCWTPSSPSACWSSSS
jgi:peptidoglycan L-alanyl-D-glutamate endopeptidase CwlK